MRAYTDLPISELGDAPHNDAPIRVAEIVSYDGKKHCRCVVEGVVKTIAIKSLYPRSGRAGEIAPLGKSVLEKLKA